MPDKKPGFFQELKRRNVYKVAVVYAITGWLIIQIAVATFPYLKLPPWMITTVIIFILIGFPVALVLAWAFELSPEGIIRTSSTDAENNPYPTRKRKPLTGPVPFTILILIMIGQFIYFNYLKKPSTQNSPNTDKSIAVLPFDNMSNDPQQDYFSDGMTDEILTDLFKIGDLKVRSRTSVMAYKGTKENIKKIAEDLGVTFILEGSVQKSGNKVRINVQLINAKTDDHLWAENYDRELKDVFSIQSEVSQKIANSLKAKISPEVKQRIENVPTSNSEAYDLFLKGREQIGFYYSKFKYPYILKALEYFNQAIALDSTYSNAYAGLGQAYWVRAQFAPDYVPRFWELAKKYALKAIDLDPGNALAYTELANVQYKWDWDKQSALLSFKKAIALDPGNPDFRDDIIFFYFRVNDCTDIEKESEILTSFENAEYDPVRYFFSAICKKDMNKIAALKAEDYGNFSGSVLMYQGKYKKYIQSVNPEDSVILNDIFGIGMEGEAYALSGDTLKAKKVIQDLNEFSKRRYISKCVYVPIYIALGQKKKALDLLEEALKERDFFIHCMKEFYVSIYRVQDDPRYKNIMDRSWIPQE